MKEVEHGKEMCLIQNVFTIFQGANNLCRDKYEGIMDCDNKTLMSSFITFINIFWDILGFYILSFFNCTEHHIHIN